MSRTTRTRLAAAIALAAALPALWASPAPSQEAEPGLRLVRTISPRMTLDTRFLEVDVAARRLFEIGQPLGGSGMQLVARDLDTLAPVGEIAIANEDVRSQSGFGGTLAALDALRHRLFLVFPIRFADDSAARELLGPNSSLLDEFGRTSFAIAVVDTLHVRLLGIRPLADLVTATPRDAGNSNRIGIKAISYYAPQQKIYLLTEDGSARLTDIEPSENTVFLHELNAAALLDADAPSVRNWSYAVPQCPMAMARFLPSIVFRSGYSRTVFFPCRWGDVLGVTPPTFVGGMMRVNLRPGATPQDTGNFSADFFPISGDVHDGLVALDPVAERFFVGADNRSDEPRVWIFDTRSLSWIGLIVTPTFFSVALDPALGRLYTLGPWIAGKVQSVVASTRGDEADQGVVETFRLPGETSPEYRAVADSVRHRLFWPTRNEYLVIEDSIAPPAAVVRTSADENTVDVAEGPRTAANFLGGGRGYGARVRWVGGWRAFERNNNTVYPPAFDTARPFYDGFDAPALPWEGTRDVHLARVPDATVSNGEATASAIGGDRDYGTDQDAYRWTAWLRDHRGPDATGDRWPYSPVTCADFGGSPARQSVRNAQVICARDDSSVQAAALADSPLELPAPPDAPGMPDVVIGESRAWSTSRLDPRRGVVSASGAEVRNLDIGGRVSIGRVAAQAETWASGRPASSNGTGAGARFTRTIEDVAVIGEDGSRTTVCRSPCSPQLVADTITGALGTRVRVELPRPDPALARGTPLGYEALVVRDTSEQANDRWLNEETDRRLEVPAMVVTLFTDGRVPARVVLSLAGVSSESHYGIYLLARELGGAPPPVLVLPPPPAAELPIDTRIPVPPPSTGGPASFIERVADGFRFALAQPGQALRAIGLWTFLLAPVILVARRRLVTRAVRRP